MTTKPNISRFSYRFSSFQGWRLSVCRQSHKFTHYFADKKYGGEAPALKAAEHTRHRLFTLLRQHGNDAETAFNICRGELVENSYPQGLRPLKTTSAHVQAQHRRNERGIAQA